MATYEYKCGECGECIERESRMSEMKQKVKCPKCGKMAPRSFGGVNGIVHHRLQETARKGRGRGR